MVKIEYANQSKYVKIAKRISTKANYYRNAWQLIIIKFVAIMELVFWEIKCFKVMKVSSFVKCFAKSIDSALIKPVFFDCK